MLVALILLIIVVIGLIRLKFEFYYTVGSGVNLKLKILFLNFKLYPKLLAKKKVRSYNVKAKQPNERKDEDGGKKKRNILKNIRMAKIFIEPIPNLLKFLNKGFNIHHFSVNINISGADAKDVAMNYARVCGVFSALFTYIFSVCKFNKKSIKIKPDFIGERSFVNIFLQASVGIGRLVVGVTIYLFTVVFKIISLSLKGNW